MTTVEIVYQVGEVIVKIAVIAGVMGLFFWGARFAWAWWTRAQMGTKKDQDTLAINQNMQNLHRVLATLEQDSSKASLLLLDAQAYTQTLVELIQAIALKAEAMQAEVESLQNALASIDSQDALKIARAAGEVKDQHIRTLMLSRVKDVGFWNDTSMVIAAEIGTLSQWQQGYRQFASNLLAEVSKAKSQLSAQKSALELVGASRPLLQIQANLGEAQKSLQIQRRPGLHEAARQLPAINTGLLR